MTYAYNDDILHKKISELSSVPVSDEMLVSLFSAAVVSADPEIIAETVIFCEKQQLPYSILYEITLQSYLFLGFPRMLTTSELLAQSYKKKPNNTVREPFDVTLFTERGEKLCRTIYGANFEKLRDKVSAYAPEVFEWMLLEGYGKTLARPELSIQLREISIMTFLLMENRQKQLYSHLRGAYTVGVPLMTISSVCKLYETIAPNGYKSAIAIIEELEKR